jgi:hypothetical protein
MPDISDFLDGDGNWKCNQCGKCCMNVSLIAPQLDAGGGRCTNLTADNQCAIYETRPDFCRVDVVTPNMPAAVNARACVIVSEYTDWRLGHA